jgi:NADH:ubiquinone oxidoreductase subunit 6 (subunit J)
VTQRNPARGAIAFAFVILSTCGLFLLLAAPFLMAATIIIYAGAIIVTFLFVLMLSQVEGPSDENDRSREPLLGGLGGFAFTGLVLFTMYLSAGDTATAKANTRSEDNSTLHQLLPAQVVTGEERSKLIAAAEEMKRAADRLGVLDEKLASLNDQGRRLPPTDPSGLMAVRDKQDALLQEWLDAYRANVHGEGEDPPTPLQEAGTAIHHRLTISHNRRETALRDDEQARNVRNRLSEVLTGTRVERARVEGDYTATRRVPRAHVDELHKLREETLLLAGTGELPARNVANIGYLLYADHLLAVELAGTLLLVATIGAIAIAKRRGNPA